MPSEDEFDFDAFDETFLEDSEISAQGLTAIPTMGRNATKPGSALRQVRTLTALGAIAHLGGAPIPRTDFEEILYFIDCLLPAIGKDVWEGVGIKTNIRPLRPDWVDEIDRLVGRGLILIDRLGNKRPIRRHCELDISMKGREIIKTCRETVREIENAWTAAIDIGGAYLRTYAVRPVSNSHLVSFDSSFRNQAVPENGIIDYGEYETRNLSSDAAKKMLHALQAGTEHFQNSKLTPQLYLTYLIEKERQNV